jgi:hypothetical protein
VVTAIPVDPVPVCTLLAAPTTITRGQSATLTWTTQNADQVLINQDIGTVLVNGSRTVSPTVTTTYTLTAKKGTREVTCVTTVTVTEAPVPVCTLTAAPQTIFRGETATLSWTTQNAGTVTLDQGIGTVTASGTRGVSPTVTTTYTLTALGQNNVSVSCPVIVTVKERPVDQPFTCQHNVAFTANPNRIEEGQSSTLSWSVTGATSVAIDQGVNTANAQSGSASVSPRTSTTYTLTAMKGTTSISCPISITVDEDNGGGGGGGSSSPRCELKASDRTIRSGERVTLTWDTRNATFVEIKDNRNRTIVTTDGVPARDKRDLYDGEIVVRPTRDTTYTLTAARGSRDRECAVKIDVRDDVVVTEVRDQQPLVTSISLTDVPYTGFDAKTIMQFSVLALLLAWAGYLGFTFYRRRAVGVTSR